MKILNSILLILPMLSCVAQSTTHKVMQQDKHTQPNIVFIFADDLRADTLGIVDEKIHTPNLDALAKKARVFNNAFSVLAVCSPSRATILTGRYPSSHGVTTYGDTPIRPGNPSFVSALKKAGYQTAVTGKWHLGNEPKELGFDVADIFHSNGPWYGREVIENGQHKIYPGFIETWSVDRSVDFIEQASKKKSPFFLWYNTQVPHMDDKFSWPATEQAMAYYDQDTVPLPVSYPPDHRATGKPPYLKHSRSYTRAMDVYGYKDENKLRAHIHDYYAAVTDMDKEIGRLLNKLDILGLSDNTIVIFMSDNGWFLGEHGLTSKVLAYKASMQVPLFISGKGIEPSVRDELVINTDMAPFILDLAGVSVNYRLDGRSLTPLLGAEKSKWRNAFYYESPTPQLVPRSFFAIRDEQYLYIETFIDNTAKQPEFIELYDVKNDPYELKNLAITGQNKTLLAHYAEQLKRARLDLGTLQ
ncbi:sulfatase-like hydrolase/transferase [Paraglaciecola arctica]|uniref:sulfatase-like hydrolase/transferase n=1 Tax=Paraglaciecola arctica TaxID=1128911 RepID=UPI001C06C6E0|nr:sulfatase-like hydrolase/transferase [Paraglaciecola arctica]MBU3005567.1 sulfatase-like hydrolase/transferase [Paraglaciecola arctica]